MSTILIVHSSTDGHTVKIGSHLKQVIEPLGHAVTLVSIDAATRTDLQAFDAIVIGASVRYGTHGKPVVDFINRHGRMLDRKANAFFSVNIVARKPGKSQPDTNPYLKTFLKRIAWRPQALAVFAGRLDYPRYGLFDRTMIRLIMWMTRGPTDPAAVIEFTDWQQVEAFGRRIAALAPRGPHA